MGAKFATYLCENEGAPRILQPPSGPLPHWMATQDDPITQPAASNRTSESSTSQPRNARSHANNPQTGTQLNRLGAYTSVAQDSETSNNAAAEIAPESNGEAPSYDKHPPVVGCGPGELTAKVKHPRLQTRESSESSDADENDLKKPSGSSGDATDKPLATGGPEEDGSGSDKSPTASGGNLGETSTAGDIDTSGPGLDDGLDVSEHSATSDEENLPSSAVRLRTRLVRSGKEIGELPVASNDEDLPSSPARPKRRLLNGTRTSVRDDRTHIQIDTESQRFQPYVVRRGTFTSYAVSGRTYLVIN